MSNTILSLLSGAPNQPRPAETRDTGARPKIADRIGGPSTSPSAEEGTLVAQKVVLYEEDPNDPAGKRYVGSAVWRTEAVPPAPGQAPDLAIRADIEIPEQKISARWSLRRNDDKALPASHTVEVMFTLPPDFPHGGITNIPGVLMKQSESTRGVPLAGLAVKVTNNFFLIGLSSVDADRARNIQLLKEQAWFDIPMVYNDGRRTIIAIEKGTPATVPLPAPSKPGGSDFLKLWAIRSARFPWGTWRPAKVVIWTSVAISRRLGGQGGRIRLSTGNLRSRGPA